MTISAAFAILLTTLQMSPSGVTLTDQRPADEEKQHTLSLAIWSCEYMVTRLSDKKMPVGRIRQLTTDLNTTLIGLRPDDIVIVKHYAVYMNEGAQVAAHAVAVATRGILVGTAQSAPRCTRDKMTAGWFDPAEATTYRPPVIAEVTVNFRGKDYSARAAYSPAIGTGYYPGNPRQLGDRVALYAQVNRLIIDQIQRDIATGAN